MSKPAAPTPFMAQYLEIKDAQPDALLFFRMGDFYELFFEDAEIAARCLDITLTARGEHDGVPIPMAGVPYHAAESYLARLIKAGHRVAICEQLERPEEAKKRGSKSVVKRGVVRVVTAGTLTEDTLLSARRGQALAAIAFAPGGNEAGLATCDISTGHVEIIALPADEVVDALAARPVTELVLPEGDDARFEGLPNTLPRVERPARHASAKRGEAAIREAWGVASTDAFGAFSRAELAAFALLFDYLRLTQPGRDIPLDPPVRAAAAGVLAIDAATRASLEIERSLSASGASLLQTIDRTLTAPGARLLADHLSQPSLDRAEIAQRHDAVGFLVQDADARDTLRNALKGCPDLERARGRLRIGRGGPRDLRALADGLRSGEALAARLVSGFSGLPDRLMRAAAALDLSRQPELAALASELNQAIADDAPVQTRDGGFIRSGYDAGLDQVRALKDDSRKVIAGLQNRYGDETGISSLKIRFNNVLGYFIEVSSRHGDALMSGEAAKTFIHRQTLASAVRFSTEELSELAGRISRAEDEALARELELFDAFCAQVEALAAPLHAFGHALAELDLSQSHAQWALEVGAIRPEIVDEPVFEAEGLRHPVVEAALRKQGEGFTANDLSLDASGQFHPRLTLVTGPNMAGKSTFLRQSALAVILAQSGGFVSARTLRLGLVDRIFSRVGASDDLSRGRSTFMVEMIETAAILNRAGPRAFVILDEVGRGTSTWDGLAIAWACVEHLHNTNACRALFATHYHELTSLAADLPHAANASLRAREWQGDLVFLHEVVPGPADKSYGVQVAKLAGLPRAAVRRAEQVLKRLEADPSTPESLPLFAAADPEPIETEEPAVLQRLREVDPDALTPREALDLLYALRDEARRD